MEPSTLSIEIFASDLKLEHLASARSWFVNGTFKVVSKPFVQLLSIHFFARSRDEMKKHPWVCVLMPRKRNYFNIKTKNDKC